MADHISTLKLHRLRYGELDEAEVRAIRTHVEGCARCAERLQVQEQERAAFVATPVPDAIRALAAQEAAPTLAERLQGWFRQPLLVGGLALAAAATIAVVSLPGDSSYTGIKGQHLVEVVVQDHGTLDPDAESIHPGDRLQLRIPPGDWEQVWVGDEEAWLGSFPVTPSKSWHLMPFSLEVDSQPGPEEIVVVLSNHPLTEQEANAALAGKKLGGVQVEQLQLHKEP